MNPTQSRNKEDVQSKEKFDPRLVRKDGEDPNEQSLEKITESIVTAFFLALIIKLGMYIYQWYSS